MKTYLIEETSDEEVIVYAWLLEKSYYKEDNVAKQESGSSIPYKFILKKNGNSFEVKSYQTPRDGSYYENDMEEIFPKEIQNQMNNIYSDGTLERLESSIQRQVNQYFNTENLTTDYNSFVGTILEETTTYMIVKPNEDEEERKTSDKIRINYGTDNIDYLYGVGRKVVIYYTGEIMETYPAQIKTNEILPDGYSDFEIIVEKSDKKEINKILNNKDLYKYNLDYDLYYYALSEVNVKIDNKIFTLEEALKDGKITLSRIITKAENDDASGKIKVEMLKDGGTKIYKYETYTIIKLNKLGVPDSIKDMYIGLPEMNINDINY